MKDDIGANSFSQLEETQANAEEVEMEELWTAVTTLDTIGSERKEKKRDEILVAGLTMPKEDFFSS